MKDKRIAVINLTTIRVKSSSPDSPFLHAGLNALRASGTTLCHARVQNMFSGE